LIPGLEAAIKGVVESTAPPITASSPANKCSSYRGFKSRKQLLFLSRLQVQQTTAPLIEASNPANKCSSQLFPGLEASIRGAVDSWT
jgi:hypothetical protein